MTNSYYIKLGALIRTARNSRNISQEQLGTVIGVTFQQVQKYEKGINRLRVDQLVAIATFLRTPINVFLDSVQNPLDVLEIAAITSSMNEEQRSLSKQILKAIAEHRQEIKIKEVACA